MVVSWSALDPRPTRGIVCRTHEGDLNSEIEKSAYLELDRISRAICGQSRNHMIAIRA
jgi:hypothetical protein